MKKQNVMINLKMLGEGILRKYIFDFDQQVALEREISLEQLLLLDYLIKFFDSGNALIKNINGKKFAWVNYNKVMTDLPILNIKDRSLRRMLTSLEQKKIIERTQINEKMFIYVNQILLYNGKNTIGEDFLTDEDKNKLLLGGGQKCPQLLQTADKNDHRGGQKCPLIVNYYKNKKIKLLLCDERVKNVNAPRFLFLLQSELKKQVSALTFDICVKDMSVVVVSENLIVLDVVSPSILKENKKGVFEACAIFAINTCFKEMDNGGWCFSWRLWVNGQ